MGTDVCTDYAVIDPSSTSLELTVAPGMEFVYTMLLYQEDEVVLVSGPFEQTNTNGKSDSKHL